MLKRKLHSRRGASILLALLYLMVCAFIGAVALGSATTSAQKTQEREADQQTYLAVSSAARLLRDAMGADECRVVETKAVCTYGAGCGNAKSPECSGKDVFPTGDTEADILTDAAWAIYMSQPHYVDEEPLPDGATAYSREFTIRADGLPDVRCDMTMDGEYHVTIRLRPVGEDGATPLEIHALTLTLDGAATETESKTETSCMHPTGTDSATGAPVYSNDKLTVYTYTTTITWPGTAIEKGVETDAP